MLAVQMEARQAACDVDSFTPLREVLNWWWLPVGTLDRDLGFPAAARDIHRHRFRASMRVSGSSESVLKLVRMDRERRGKRLFDQVGGQEGRRRDLDLRQRLDREEEEQRRQQLQRDADAQRRREEEGRARERRGREQRHYQLPPLQNLRGRDSGRGAPRSSGSAQGERGNPIRALTEGGTPATGVTAHIVCYHCGKTRHIQADCKDESFCVKCNKSGHLSAICVIRLQQKLVYEYSRNWTKQKPTVLFSTEPSRTPKRRRRGDTRRPRHRAARPHLWLRRPMGWAPRAPDAAPSPIYSFRRENPSTESHDTRKVPETPPPSTLPRGVQKIAVGTLPERGIITGGLYITMPASGLMRE
ncbi:hypothetical protein QYE76_066322 [Lolium multiflorum]|uniref:CCHC-type domain-containing protein n=1 Tax=Lolium multiflorum TaxID=4521 RepID=A0AAD8SAD8_LOLMU|nr:hypothetical protein QYE76_066322 [Lolium multiflorum]